MSVVNVNVALDYITRMDEVARHVSSFDGAVSAWIDFDGFTMHGRNPEMFRRLAARCSEAAAILEAAKVEKPAVELPSAEDVRGILKADEPVQAESGVA